MLICAYLIHANWTNTENRTTEFHDLATCPRKSTLLFTQFLSIGLVSALSSCFRCLIPPAALTFSRRDDGFTIFQDSSEVWPAVCSMRSYSRSQCWQNIPWVCYGAESTSKAAIHCVATISAPRNWRSLHRRHHLLYGMRGVLYALSKQLANIITGHWRSD